MKKLSMIVVLIGCCVSLIGCGSNNDKEKTRTENESVTAETTSESEEIWESTDSSDGAALTEKDVVETTVNKSFVDEEQGYTITVEEVVKNIPGDYTGGSSDGTFVGVACKVLVASTEEKLISGFNNDFKLVVGNEIIKNEGSFINFSGYTKEQGWERIDYTTGKGETREGWVMFKVDSTDIDKPLIFRYARSEIPVTVIGGDNYTIPAQNFDIEL